MPAYNGTMSTRSTDYREAVDHLPEGAILVLQDVPWDDYEQLLDDLVDRPGVRATYDQGRLEIMSPRQEHEASKEFIIALVRALSEELDAGLESYGSTTWKRKKDVKGTEADACFYIANAQRVIGKREIDLSVDPPPDLVVEIDVTNESLSKFPIYSTFGVPEIWRYDSKRHRSVMYELRGKSYAEITASRFFPILTVDVLADFVEQSKTQGQKTALAAFRRWAHKRQK